MNAESLARHQADLGVRVARATREHAGSIRLRVRAAQAHGRNVLSGATRTAQEGRPTIARVSWHPSFKAGVADLLGALDAILGAAEVERVAAYRESFRFWDRQLPDSVRAGRPAEALEPTVRQQERARTAVVPSHGRTLREEIALAVRKETANFKVAVVRAGNKATPMPEALDALSVWARGAEGRLTAVLARVFNDAITLSDRLAGRDVVRSDLLVKDPNLPEAVYGQS